jgi:hypothetical protein
MLQSASCARVQVNERQILIVAPATNGHLAEDELGRLETALTQALAARGLSAATRRTSSSVKPCQESDCLIEQGKATRSGVAVAWSIERGQVMWAKTTAASLPVETPAGNKHASETTLTQAGALQPRSASTAQWKFSISLYSVSADKKLGEETVDCVACTQGEAEYALVSMMSRLLDSIPPQKK